MKTYYDGLLRTSICLGSGYVKISDLGKMIYDDDLKNLNYLKHNHLLYFRVYGDYGDDLHDRLQVHQNNCH